MEFSKASMIESLLGRDVQALRQPGRADEEDIRLVGGFADVFAAVVIGGLLIALGVIGSPLANYRLQTY